MPHILVPQRKKIIKSLFSSNRNRFVGHEKFLN
jgi:hypothetical protein